MKSSLSLKELTGQMLIAGFEGTRLTDKTRALIQDRKVGGLILFERNFENPAQLFALNRELQNAAASANLPPLFISVDQEGGRVSRLKTPFTAFPPPGVVGAAGSDKLARRFGEALGAELAATGINMDYAPCLDVHSNPQNPIIGARAFSSDPQAVGRLAVQFMHGMQGAGVIPVGKHFPGHGDTSQDSHLELPTVDRPAESLEALELIPFAHAVEQGLQVVMTAHVMYPAWDEEYPATFSRKIVQGILRERLGFEGVIVSDDLEMKAVEKHFKLEDVPALGVEAGLDQFMICHGFEKIEALQDQMIADVEKGDIRKDAIERSAGRIVKLKETMDAPPDDAPDFAALAAAHQKLADRPTARGHQKII